MSTPGKAGSAGPERDPVLDRVYAAGAREEPPAGLDAAIRAAARREVHARPGRVGAALRGWHMPVAIAAVLVFSVSVGLLMREEGADRLDHRVPAAAQAPASERRAEQPGLPSAQPESAPPAATAVREAATANRDALAPLPAAAEEDQSRKRETQAEPAAVPSRRTDLPRPAAAPFAQAPASPAELPRAVPAAPEARALAKEAQSGVTAAPGQSGRAVPSSPAPSPPAAAEAAGATAGKLADKSGTAGTELARPMARIQEPLQASRDSVADASRPPWFELEGQPPEKWLARIEELRRAGRGIDADRVLDEFRRRYPDDAGPAAGGK